MTDTASSTNPEARADAAQASAATPALGAVAPGAEALVVFTPSGKRGRFAHGTPVLSAARKLGVDIDSVCGGRGLCGRCQVVPGNGHFAKHGVTCAPTHLNAVGESERRYDRRKGLAAGRRLSCQALIEGDMLIDVPADAQVHKQVVRKAAEARDIPLDPLVRLYLVEVEQPDMHDPRGDLTRLQEALSREWGLAQLACPLPVLRQVQKTLRAGNWQVTAAVYDGREIVALYPGLCEAVHGVAIDIGSTTMSAHLCDLTTGAVLASAGIMNPQIRFGEDLMSRVSYAMMNPGGEAEMTAAVRAAIDTLLAEVAAEAGIDRATLLDLVFVGNPVMHHLLLGLDPVELGGAPFALATDGAQSLDARDLGLSELAPAAKAYVLPCIAGHVGADAAAVALAEAPYKQEPLTLIVDVGTNAEILLGTKERVLACSSPTGPAFEGAQIACGQRAAPGAIERVRIDRTTLAPRFKVIGCDLWSDEPGFAAATAKIGVTGICGSGIIEVLAEMFLAGILKTDGTIDGDLAARTERVFAEGRTFAYRLHEGSPEIAITQNDVRAIQLAKAALYAGARLLMDRYGADTVERIVLAGAFGAHIDTTYATVLGLLPDCDLDHVRSAGNAAGTGARMALLNKGARAEIEGAVRRIEKIETAIEPQFQAHFVEAMALPHASAAYPNLAARIDLPVPSTPTPAAERQGRRRRRAAPA